jgi:hypothetical protein
MSETKIKGEYAWLWKYAEHHAPLTGKPIREGPIWPYVVWIMATAFGFGASVGIFLKSIQ